MIAGLVLLAVLVVFQKQTRLSKRSESSNNPTFTPASQEPSLTPNNQVKTKPTVTSPQANSRVKSPLTVTGSVPPGWMFEGVFPIKLLDANRKLIKVSQAKETVPGSWNSGQDVEFKANLTFTTQAKSGFLVLEKDNPSGLPENADIFEMPVNF